MIDEFLAEAYAILFFSAIVVFAVLETLLPRRDLACSLRTRWLGNIGTTVVGTVALGALVPITGVAFAQLMFDRGVGILNVVQLPSALELVAAVLLLDLARYLQHVLFHRNAFLWRLHRLHHTDRDVDFTTEFRVHPLEMLVGAGIALTVIAVVGPSVLAIVLFNFVFAVQAFWTHSNVRFPSRVDRVVRLVFTTPDVHRIHHSEDLHESNSNLGAMFTWWDRLFGTFVEQPAQGHENMVLGVAEFGDPRHMSLPWMLADPFLDPGPAAADRRPAIELESRSG